MNKRSYLMLTVVVALLGFANASTGQEEKLERVRVGVASDSATESAIWFAKEARMFEKYGLFVELIRLQGSSLVVSTMLAGEIPIGQIGASAVIDSDLGGADLTVVASIIRNFVFNIFSRPEIEKWRTSKER